MYTSLTNYENTAIASVFEVFRIFSESVHIMTLRVHTKQILLTSLS